MRSILVNITKYEVYTINRKVLRKEKTEDEFLLKMFGSLESNS